MRKIEITVTFNNSENITVNQITNDKFGNPRFVIHYLAIADKFSDALAIAEKIGGKLYTAKWYGGGIVFSTYTLEHTLEQLMQYAGKL